MPNARDILVIGGSAGAVKPLRSLIRLFAADFPMAVFAVVHTRSDRDSLLPVVLNTPGGIPPLRFHWHVGHSYYGETLIGTRFAPRRGRPHNCLRKEPTMRSASVLQRPTDIHRTNKIADRRREISAHWTPVERGRRLLLAAARQADLCARLGFGRLATDHSSSHPGHAPHHRSHKAGSR
jgi:CheB methylesterase